MSGRIQVSGISLCFLAKQQKKICLHLERRHPAAKGIVGSVFWLISLEGGMVVPSILATYIHFSTATFGHRNDTTKADFFFQSPVVPPLCRTHE